MAGIPGYSSSGAYASQPAYYQNLYPHLEPGYGQSVQHVQQAQQREEYDEEDSASEAESVQGHRAAISFSRAQGLACGGMLLMTIIACVPLLQTFAPGLTSDGDKVYVGSPQGLFRSQELASVATDNVMAALGGGSPGRRLQSAPQREHVMAAVVEGFKNIDNNIRVRYPSAHRGLCEAHMSLAQKEAVLNAMRHMRDPRVQSLGRSLLHAAIPGMNSQDSVMIKLAVLKHVQSFFREARTLRDEIVPASLRHQQNHLVDAADVDKMQLLKSFNRWHAESHSGQQARRLFSLSHMGSLTYTKTPFTVTGQGMSFGPIGSSMVKSMSGQAQAFFHQINGYYKYLGLDDLKDNIFGGQDYSEFKKCAAQHLMNLDPSAEAGCFSTFANTAYDEIQNTNFSRIMKSKTSSIFPSSSTQPPALYVGGVDPSLSSASGTPSPAPTTQPPPSGFLASLLRQNGQTEAPTPAPTTQPPSGPGGFLANLLHPNGQTGAPTPAPTTQPPSSSSGPGGFLANLLHPNGQTGAPTPAPTTPPPSSSSGPGGFLANLLHPNGQTGAPTPAPTTQPPPSSSGPGPGLLAKLFHPNGQGGAPTNEPPPSGTAPILGPTTQPPPSGAAPVLGQTTQPPPSGVAPTAQPPPPSSGGPGPGLLAKLFHPNGQGGAPTNQPPPSGMVPTDQPPPSGTAPILGPTTQPAPAGAAPVLGPATQPPPSGMAPTAPPPPPPPSSAPAPGLLARLLHPNGGGAQSPVPQPSSSSSSGGGTPSWWTSGSPYN